MHHLPPLRAPVVRSPLAVAVNIVVILLLVAGLAALSLRGEVPAAPLVMAGDAVPAAVETVPAAAPVDATIDYANEQPPTF